jgi:hypothetical protein
LSHASSFSSLYESLLPSCLYLPRPNEFAPGALALPWDDNPPHLVGELAKKRGAENPTRLVHSAKSWLAVAADMPHLSAVEASRAYLAHLRAATPDFDAHNVLLTVPASFDAAARNLTLEAARQAGYPTPVLLEEPQAAFYAWLERHPDWRERIHPGALILVTSASTSSATVLIQGSMDNTTYQTLKSIADPAAGPAGSYSGSAGACGMGEGRRGHGGCPVCGAARVRGGLQLEEDTHLLRARAWV